MTSHAEWCSAQVTYRVTSRKHAQSNRGHARVRVQGVAEAVAEEVDAEAGEGDGEAE